jgi:hypothetical protein
MHLYYIALLVASRYLAANKQTDPLYKKQQIGVIEALKRILKLHYSGFLKVAIYIYKLRSLRCLHIVLELIFL